MDEPHPSLLLSCHRPSTIEAQLSPVVNRVGPSSCDSGDISIHLTHLKRNREQRQQAPRDFAKIDALLLSKPIPPSLTARHGLLTPYRVIHR